MKKIALIITYFGELPFWFPAFQHSCRYNPDIQWLIFSDADRPKECSENITFIKYSVNDFCKIATKKIGVRLTINHSYLYKICDFKPTFGLIYEDYIKEYDFWGHCDLDIVWGKINNFIDDNLLEKYDIITSRLRRISGHFCLYRNTDEIKSFYLKMPLSIQLLQDSRKYQKIDEEFFSNYLNLSNTPNWFYRIKNFFVNEKKIRVYWDKILTTSGKDQRVLISNHGKYFKWENGKVYSAEGEELMYIHFHVLKKMPSFNICDIGNRNFFTLSSFGIKKEMRA
jgi:hypothetical protein